jgi:hypothetical protein
MYFKLSVIVSLLFAARLIAADRPPVATSVRILRLLSVDDAPGSERVLVAYPNASELVKLRVSHELLTKIYDMAHGHEIFLKATIRPDGKQGDEWLVNAEPYSAPAELAAPRAWIYDGLNDLKSAVRLTKYEITIQALLSPHDAALRDRLQGFKPGDIVEVELNTARTPATLLDIDGYHAPHYGDFVKLQNVKNGGKMLSGIVLTVGEEQRTFLLPVAGPSAPPSATAANVTAHKLKPGYQVLYTMRDVAEGSDPVIRDLRLDVVTGVNSLGTRFVAPFVTVGFNPPASGPTRVTTWKQFGHPDDIAFDNGIRLIVTFPDRAPKVGVNADDQKRIQAIRSTFQTQGFNLPAEEKAAFVAAYTAWREAKDPAQRERLEQQIDWAVAELSNRLRAEMESRLTLFRAFITADQMKMIIEMGKN